MDPAALFLLSIPASAMALGLREKYLLAQKTAAIKYRINVNGTRGKSTVTRFLTAALLEAGIPTVGKATGSKSCLLEYKKSAVGLIGEERELPRGPEGANIREIKQAIHAAARGGAQALVAECMAVNPEYQRVYAREFLKSNITVITNVLEDHLDVLGPTLKNMAEYFLSAVPAGSTLVISPGEFANYFQQAGATKGLKVHVADSRQVAIGYCENFSYLVFPENVALALETAKIMGVPKDVALAGMLRAIPDAGALLYKKVKGKAGEGTLISAFSANDPTSTMAIWDYLLARNHVDQGTTLLLNCRNDRFERGLAFYRSVLRNIQTHSLILMGEGTGYFSAKRKNLPFTEVVDLGRTPAHKVAMFLQNRCRDKDVFFGIGNYLGVETLIKELEGGANV